MFASFPVTTFLFIVCCRSPLRFVCLFTWFVLSTPFRLTVMYGRIVCIECIITKCGDLSLSSFCCLANFYCICQVEIVLSQQSLTHPLACDTKHDTIAYHAVAHVTESTRLCFQFQIGDELFNSFPLLLVTHVEDVSFISFVCFGVTVCIEFMEDTSIRGVLCTRKRKRVINIDSWLLGDMQ